MVMPVDERENTEGELQLVEVRAIWEFFHLMFMKHSSGHVNSDK